MVLAEVSSSDSIGLRLPDQTLFFTVIFLLGWELPRERVPFSLAFRRLLSRLSVTLNLLFALVFHKLATAPPTPTAPARKTAISVARLAQSTCLSSALAFDSRAFISADCSWDDALFFSVVGFSLACMIVMAVVGVLHLVLKKPSESDIMDEIRRDRATIQKREREMRE